MFKKIIGKFYNQFWEDLSTRLLYLMNTLDTYFMIAGFGAWLFCFPSDFHLTKTVLAMVLAIIVFHIADFHPYFMLLSIPAWLILFPMIPAAILVKVLLLNLVFFILIQYLFMGVPNSIISRDPRVGFIMLFNSLFTLAPTAVSFVVSFFFASGFSLILLKKPLVSSSMEVIFWVILFLASLVTFLLRKKTRPADFGRWPIKGEYFKRVVLLNIDGCRFDFVKALDLPYKKELMQGGYFENGLLSVYRALTNPAFASILTGAPPRIHRVLHNLYGQRIKVEALPDYIPSILYGSMHVKHFSKPHWKVKVVSLPTHSIYKSDDIVFDALREDLKNSKDTRLFIVDLSEADFLGHCYGSYGKTYKKALQLTFGRIGSFIEWMKKEGDFEDTAVIVCSDHGMSCIDHSYLLFYSESYVPFFILGEGIKFLKRNPASIMDICNTVSYLLGERYARQARGGLLFDLEDQQQAQDFIKKLKQIFQETAKELNYTPDFKGKFLSYLYRQSGFKVNIPEHILKRINEKLSLAYAQPVNMHAEEVLPLLKL